MNRLTWKEALVYFVLGVLFAVGLSVSGMTQPHKVVRFLDFAGKWEPDLLFVMGGGLVTYAILIRLIVRREEPLFGGMFSWPTRKDIDWRLLSGAALFGVGWGAAGYCPGPVLTSIATLSWKVLLFVGSMLAGMFLFQKFDALTTQADESTDS